MLNYSTDLRPAGKTFEYKKGVVFAVEKFVLKKTSFFQ